MESNRTDFKPRDYWVVFERRPIRFLIDRLLHPSYRHCYVYWAKDIGEPGLMTSRCTLKAEHLATKTSLDVFWVDPEDVKDQGPFVTNIVKYRSAPSRVPYIRGPLSCAELIKTVLDIRAPFVYTPYQLYKWLLRNGGVSV